MRWVTYRNCWQTTSSVVRNNRMILLRECNKGDTYLNSCELKYVSPFRSRHWVESAWVEWVAFQDSLGREPQSPNDTVLLDRAHGVVRTRRVKAAAIGEQR